MGLQDLYLRYINESVAATLGSLSGTCVLELGNQEIESATVIQKTGKEYFVAHKAEHVSVDLNALDGALPLDLREPAQFTAWHGYFDVIVNSGTTEHVEPLDKQYECFQILHDCLKPGGVEIHLVPDIDERNNNGEWVGHCNNYYSQEFFRMLARENGYELVSVQIINGLVCACLRKLHDAPFMADRERLVNHITRLTGGIVYPGINDGAAPRGLRKHLRKFRLARWVKRVLAPVGEKWSARR